MPLGRPFDVLLYGRSPEREMSVVVQVFGHPPGHFGSECAFVNWHFLSMVGSFNPLS
jgi:hypothetical protein